MERKKLHLILTIFSLIVFCTMALIFTGCSLDQQLWDAREETNRKAAEQDAKEEQKEEIRAWEEERKILEEDEVIAAEEVTEESAVSEDKKSFPDEPITYTGNLYNENGTKVILIVNFKTTGVTGPISLDSTDDYIDATINGKIDLDTLEITSNYSGIWRLKETDEEFPFDGAINGKITEDLSTFNGIIHPDYSEVGVEFTAIK